MEDTDQLQLKERRYQAAMRVKMQAQMCNYGLPENVDVAFPHLAHLSVDEARAKLKAIRELWVRLDLWVTTGGNTKGIIEFPQAKREIRYNLVGNRPENTEVLFKSLVPSRGRMRRR